jgi:radical SAM protein with 4Fe4S-binding SPASM domain
MRDQIGILCDGTVVPCCLDHEGDIPLGNILQQPLEEILDSDRANAIYNGFLSGNAAEDLCRRCGYAQRFQK